MTSDKTIAPLAGASAQSAPSPALLFDTINAYQKTAAIKSAIELDVFTAIAGGATTPAAIAAQCQAAPRGIRILCDFLTLLGFLTKAGESYALTPDSALFPNRKSPAYAGRTIDFLHAHKIKGAFDDLTTAVRQGGTALPPGGTVAPEHPVWTSFARNMGPLMAPAAGGLAELIALDPNRAPKILDISTSHGMWGLAFARKHPQARIVGLDWPAVLDVAKENARAAGLAERFSTIAGNAFEVELGTDYDVVLVPNFLHHFNAVDCVRFLKRVHTALRANGVVVIVEFVPNPDRVTPSGSASFSLMMLASTPEGDAYTLAEYREMLAQAGFKPPVQHNLPASVNVALIAAK